MLQASLEYENGETQTHPLEADESKKSVYWSKSLPSVPSGNNGTSNGSGSIKSLTIATDDSNSFLIGGFQLQGMAKSVKVYVDDVDRLVMSVRGIKSTRLQAFFKAQCVIPGGPRPVQRFVRLELEPAAMIHQIRWTLRMRDDDPEEEKGGGGNNVASNGAMPIEETTSSVGADGIDQAAGSTVSGDSRNCQDIAVPEPPIPEPPNQPLPDEILLQSANTVVNSAAATVQNTNGLLSAPAIASITQHMAELTSAMRELTATIKNHQQFLKDQQHRQSHSASEHEI